MNVPWEKACNIARKTAGKVPGRSAICRLRRLRVEDRDDLVRARVEDDDLIADHNVVIAAPLGIDHEYLPRQRVEVDAIRNAGSHAYRNVQMRRFHPVLLEDGAEIRVVKITDDGELDVKDLQKKLSSKTKIFAFTACSNTLGTINDCQSLVS